MKSRTITALLWLLAIGIFLLAFFYHHHLKQLYDHYLLDTTWLLNLPTILALSALFSSTTKKEPKNLSPSTQHILSLIFIVFYIVLLFFVIKPFLGLEFLFATCIFIILAILFPLEQKRLKEGKSYNSARTGVVSIILYSALLFIIPFSYIQVTNPLTMEESKAIIARDHPAYTYSFCSTNTRFQKELDTSLGYYLYISEDGGLHQSVRTGEIAFTASPYGL